MVAGPVHQKEKVSVTVEIMLMELFMFWSIVTSFSYNSFFLCSILSHENEWKIPYRQGFQLSF